MHKAVVYKIVHRRKASIMELPSIDKNEDHVYVGSTTNLLQRSQQHKSDCRNEKSPRHKNYLYEFIRGNGGWDEFRERNGFHPGNEWEIVELEQVVYDDRKELLMRERHWTKELKADLNKNVQCRTKEEYYNDNKDAVLEKIKQFNKINAERISFRKRIYYEKHKDKIIQRSKEYYSKNADKVRQYYLDNKERINAYQKQYKLGKAKLLV